MSTILLIEDDVFIQHLLALRLHNKNYTVLLAEDGISGIETAVTYQPDLILMDIQMPVMDGISATKKIRKLEFENGKRPHIIALTAHATEDFKQFAVDSGMNDFIVKPIRRETLQHVLVRYFQNHPSFSNEEKNGG